MSENKTSSEQLGPLASDAYNRRLELLTKATSDKGDNVSLQDILRAQDFVNSEGQLGGHLKRQHAVAWILGNRVALLDLIPANFVCINELHHFHIGYQDGLLTMKFNCFYIPNYVSYYFPEYSDPRVKTRLNPLDILTKKQTGSVWSKICQFMSDPMGKKHRERQECLVSQLTSLGFDDSHPLTVDEEV
jgi:hypothetical protein